MKCWPCSGTIGGPADPLPSRDDQSKNLSSRFAHGLRCCHHSVCLYLPGTPFFWGGVRVAAIHSRFKLRAHDASRMRSSLLRGTLLEHPNAVVVCLRCRQRGYSTSAAESSSVTSSEENRQISEEDRQRWAEERQREEEDRARREGESFSFLGIGVDW